MNGAGSRGRTDVLSLEGCSPAIGRYPRKWSERPATIRQPLPWQGNALPIELRSRICYSADAVIQNPP